MKNVLARILALWALIFFVPTMFIAIIFYSPCFVLKEPQKAQWHRKVSQVWMGLFIWVLGCSLRVKGKEVFKGLESCVIVCNHNSLMDVPVTTPFMTRANKTIAKKGMSKIPVFGWIYSFGSVLVDRDSDKSRRESYMEMKKMLKYGLDMVIYPEGTRNRTNDPLKTFHDGAFKLAVEMKKPVVPTIVFNTRKVLPVNKPFYVWPQKLQMHFLEPVSAENITSRELKEKVFKIMWDYYAAHAS